MDNEIDPLILPLCQVLNGIPGVKTIYSCSGHPNALGYTDGKYRGTYLMMLVKGNIRTLRELKIAFSKVKFWGAFAVTVREGQTDDPYTVRVCVDLFKRETKKVNCKIVTEYLGFTEDELKRCFDETINALQPLIPRKEIQQCQTQ